MEWSKRHRQQFSLEILGLFVFASDHRPSSPFFVCKFIVVVVVSVRNVNRHKDDTTWRIIKLKANKNHLGSNEDKKVKANNSCCRRSSFNSLSLFVSFSVVLHPLTFVNLCWALTMNKVRYSDWQHLKILVKSPCATNGFFNISIFYVNRDENSTNWRMLTVSHEWMTQQWSDWCWRSWSSFEFFRRNLFWAKKVWKLFWDILRFWELSISLTLLISTWLKFK